MFIREAVGVVKAFTDCLEANQEEPKPQTQCVLPGCENLTAHNGGYCCAEHCKQHREMRKERDNENKDSS